MITILTIAILVISVVIHELSHGYAADALGDPTARLQGRLTVNPLKHIDPVGSILVPLLTSLGGFTFGWAKPVPYNPYNLRNKRVGEFLIAAAGPTSNLLIALVFGMAIRFLADSFGTAAFMEMFVYIVVINISLAIFNLVPLPPLDGSKLLFSLFPDQYGRTRQALEAYGPVFAIIVIFFLWKFIAPVIPWVFKLFTGFSF